MDVNPQPPQQMDVDPQFPQPMEVDVNPIDEEMEIETTQQPQEPSRYVTSVIWCTLNPPICSYAKNTEASTKTTATKR